MDLSRRKNKKRLIAMVSWTIPLVYIVEKNADDNDLADHPTNPHRGKHADSNGLIDPFDTASIFYLLIVLQKILIITLEIEKRRLVDMTMTRSIL